MSQRNISFVEGEFYHLYNRGNSKQPIFLDDEDRNRFIKLLCLCNSEKKFDFRDDIVNKKIDAFDFDRGTLIISIGAWVLMPNHFHLYLTIPAGHQGYSQIVINPKVEKVQKNFAELLRVGN